MKEYESSLRGNVSKVRPKFETSLNLNQIWDGYYQDGTLESWTKYFSSLSCLMIPVILVQLESNAKIEPNQTKNNYANCPTKI